MILLLIFLLFIAVLLLIIRTTYLENKIDRLEDSIKRQQGEL